MKLEGFTAGNWKMEVQDGDEWYFGHGDGKEFIIIAEDGSQENTICVFSCNTKEEKANAELLRAAPSLLRQNRELREALKDAQDFLQAIVEATDGAGRIDENSIMRPGQRLKRTAVILNARARKALQSEGL